MIRWINQARANQGLSGATDDRGLRSIAANWSSEMARQQQLSHNPSYAQQIFNARPAATTVSENVGRGTGSTRSLFDAFMGSPGHRANILGGQFTHVTVGCVYGPSGQIWTTMDFWG